MRPTFTLFRFGVLIILNVVAFAVYAKDIDTLEDREDALDWLNKIQYAGKKINYSGIYSYQQAHLMRASRVTHVSDGTNDIEKIETLDGRAMEYIRKNEEITCYLPDAKILLLENITKQEWFPAKFSVDSASLKKYYNIKKGEVGRVAGFDCQVIVLSPKDNLRYGYKLWAEKSSGLLLRAQTINEKKEIVDQISFNAIRIGDIDKNQVKPSYENTKGWHLESAALQKADTTGWTVTSVPPGFKKTHEIKRLISHSSTKNNHAGRNSGGNIGNPQLYSREVSQIVYSDGLSAISVFIEPHTPNRTDSTLQQGAINITSKRHGNFWLTVVGAVPPLAIKNLSNSIEFRAK